MKPFYHPVPILLSWLVLSPCTCHHTLDRNHSNNIQCIDRERDALLRFKHGINSDDCGLLASWGTHIDCCQWHGVLCNNLPGHVVMLNLVGKYSSNGSNVVVVSCLEGKLSPSLGDLNHLEHLDLSMNAFYGEIPRQFGNLSKLTSLDLRSSFSGNLYVKSLSWISRVSLLRYLDLSSADLSEVTNWLTIVNILPSLSVLRMSDCQLPSKIPSSFSHINSSTTLRIIDLSANNFKDGSILQWLLNLPRVDTHLVYLDLSFNFFEVPVPIEFGNLHSLLYLSLSNNAFQGNVFKIIKELCNL